ncbi:MAG TPA: carboxypeptidase-like regulatory domain-containing protein [Thermoanaerobaculia bacterium]|nr:carboxypeptidase-like regulatory domain-containing protein [Thermoanaerobaculia bacterium]
MELLRRESRDASGRRRLAGLAETVAVTSVTDPAGLFVLRPGEAGPWRVRVESGRRTAFECAVPILPVAGDLPPLETGADGGRMLPGSSSAESPCWVPLPARVSGASPRVTQDGAEIAVRVLDAERAAVAGALLWVAGQPAALTDRDGRATVHALHPLPASGQAERPVVIEATMPGGASARWMGSRQTATGVGSPPPATAEAVLALQPQRELAIRVSDARSGEPLVGTWVRFEDRLWRAGDSGSLRIAVPAIDMANGATPGTEAMARTPPAAESSIEVAAVGYGSRRVSLAASSRRAATSILEVALEPRSIAEGWVVGEAGFGLGNVELVAEPVASARQGTEHLTDRRRWTRSGGRGDFRLQELEPGVLYVVEAIGLGSTIDAGAVEAGVSTASTRAEPLRARLRFGAPGPREARSDLRIELARKRPAYGWVVSDAEGVERPVAGASVILQELSLRSPALGARTGDDGRFELAHLPPGGYDLVVRAPGFARGVVEGLEVPEEEPACELGTVILDPGIVLEVRVQERGGGPVAGASVAAQQFERHPATSPRRQRVVPPPSEGAVARTGDDGLARVGGLDAGRQGRLRVAASGFVTTEVAGIEVPADDVVEVWLERGSEVSGVVLDEAGSHLVGAFVSLHPDGDVSSTPIDHLFQYTDEGGRFALRGAPAGAVRVAARALGAAEIDSVAISVPRGGVVSGLVLREPAHATLEGRVRTIEGAPVAGAVVVAAGQLEHTGDDGSFRIEKVRSGVQRLEVRSQEHGTAEREVEVSAAGAWIEIELGESATVVGIVVDTAGEPVADLEVFARPMRPIGDPPSNAAHSDAAGSFRIGDLRPGPHLLSVLDDEWALVPGSMPFEVEAASAPSPTRLVVVRGARVVGVLHGLEPGERALVRVVGDGGEVWGPSHANDLDPRFLIPRVPPGEHRLIGEVILPEGAAAARAPLVVAPHDLEVELDLELERENAEEVAVRGRVLVDGTPLPGLYLLLVPPDFRALRASAATDAAGRFELCCARPGRYDLMAGTRGSALAYLGPVDVEADLDLQLELRRTEVRGQVVDAESGRPIAGATLTVVGPAEPAGYHASTRVTGRDGRFRLFAMVFDGFRLRVAHAGHAGTELGLSAGQVVDVGVVALAPGGAAALSSSPPRRW